MKDDFYVGLLTAVIGKWVFNIREASNCWNTPL
jgi:hypothetical protein